MKNTYAKPILSATEESSLLKNATIVFDTNILLNFHKYSTATFQNARDIVKKLKDRLFLPYQVGLEYYQKKSEIIKEQRELPDFLKKTIDRFFNGLNLHKGSDFYSIIEKYGKEIKEAITKKAKEIQSPKPEEITQFWETVYQGKNSSAPSSEERIKLCDLIKRRYEFGIPPGFSDLAKKSNLYGDALIWFDILKYAKNNQKDIIFVSEDTKPDWVKDGNLRLELVEEFQTETHHKIKHYTFESFLKKISKQQGSILPPNTQKELKRVAENLKQIQERYQNLWDDSGIKNSLKAFDDKWRNPLKSIIENNLQNYSLNSIEKALFGLNPLEKACPDLYKPLHRLVEPDISALDELNKKF